MRRHFLLIDAQRYLFSLISNLVVNDDAKPDMDFAAEFLCLIGRKIDAAMAANALEGFGIAEVFGTLPIGVMETHGIALEWHPIIDLSFILGFSCGGVWLTQQRGAAVI